MSINKDRQRWWQEQQQHQNEEDTPWPECIMTTSRFCARFGAKCEAKKRKLI